MKNFQKVAQAQTNHKIKITGGQDAGTLYDLQQIQELVGNLSAGDVLAALKAGLNK